MEDGNGRMSNTCLIKWIADDLELPLYMPENPNILDQQGLEALLRDIYSGMRRFQSFSEDKSKSFPNVETLIDQAKIRGLSWDVIHQGAKLPAQIISRLVSEDKAK